MTSLQQHAVQIESGCKKQSTGGGGGGIGGSGSGGMAAAAVQQVMAACSTKWKWLKNNQLEVAEVMVAWQQLLCSIAAHNGSGYKNQLEVAVVAKEAAAVLEWWQLQCNKAAAQNGSGCKKQSTRGGGKGGSGSGGGVATLPCNIIMAAQSRSGCKKSARGGSGGKGGNCHATGHGSMEHKMEVAEKTTGGSDDKDDSGIGDVAATLPCNIVMAACSTKWKWLQKTSQPEIVVVAKEAAAVLEWWQLPCNKVAACSAQWKWLQKHQPEVAVVAKEAAAVVAWQQLPCNKVAACSTKWKWLQKINQLEVVVVAKEVAAVVAWQQLPCNTVMSVLNGSGCKKEKVTINRRWQWWQRRQ